MGPWQRRHQGVSPRTIVNPAVDRPELSGDDVITGGSGNDRIDPGEGSDSVSGGTDNDTFLAGSEASATGALDAFDGGSGTDLIDYSQRTSTLFFNSGGPAERVDRRQPR